MVDDQLKLSRFNGEARNQTVQLPARRSANNQDAAECVAQRLDKNSKMAPVNAAGSRLGPSWLTF